MVFCMFDSDHSTPRYIFRVRDFISDSYFIEVAMTLGIVPADEGMGRSID